MSVRTRPTDMRIYRNLHKNNWTIQVYLRGKGWRKHGSMERVAAPKVYFRVNENGAERVRRERRKNVHAFAYVGYYTLATVDPCDTDLDITYNPYNGDGFACEAMSHLSSAKSPIFETDGHIYARSAL